MDPGIPHTTRTYERVLLAVKRNGVRYYQATERRIKLGPMALTILPPGHFGDLNNDSAVVRLDFGEFSCLFAGDIEREREQELIRIARDKLDVDVLKVPHHGSSSGTTIAFLRATTPEVAVISCGRGNRYGHPHQETLQALQSLGIAVYRTDLNGTVLVETDGKTYKVIPEKGEPRGPPEEVEKTVVVVEQGKTAEKAPVYRYVASKNSEVFHYVWCRYAQKIKPENRIYFFTREEAIASGRRPCKVCRP